jgi:hypothetical protein
MKVVWFDDEIDDALGQFLCDEIRRVGHEIECVQVVSREKALNSLDELLPGADLTIIDWNLGLETLDGIELSQRILQRWRGPLLFLTRFPKKEALWGAIDPRISGEECEKPEDYSDGTLAAWFREKFRPAMERTIDRTSSFTVPVERSVAPRFFLIDAKDFYALPVDGQLDLKKDAANGIREDLTEIFRGNNSPWVVVTSWPPAVVRVGYPGDQPPGKESLRAIANDWQRPALVVLRPATVNTVTAVGSTRCAPGGPMRSTAGRTVVDWFPTVSLEMKNRRFDFHFDTGAELSFFSYPFMKAQGTAPSLEDGDDWNALPLRIGLASTAALLVFAWRPRIRVPSTQGHLEAEVAAYLVRDFDGSGLFLECGDTCPLAAEPDGSCRYRRGLVGRDVLIHTGWNAVVATTDEKVFFLSNDQYRDLVGQSGTPQPRRRRFTRY